MSITKKRGSIALARSLCYQINGAADDIDDMDGGGYGSVDIAEILSAEVVRLQEALAQPAQEPVAEVKPKMTGGNVGIATVIHEIYSPHREPLQPGDKLYTTPPQREWVGLTDEDKHKPDMGKYVYLNDDWLDGYQTGMEYAEAKLKEKNFD